MADEVVTKKINLEVDVSGTSSVAGPNRFQKWIELAQAVDSWRIFPRAFLTTYIVLLYKVTVWFMGLDEPSLEQSGLVSIVVYHRVSPEINSYLCTGPLSTYRLYLPSVHLFQHRVQTMLPLLQQLLRLILTVQTMAQASP